MKKIFILLVFSVLCTSCLSKNEKQPQGHTSSPQAQTSVSADIKPFLEKYFSSWSNVDMKTYKSCFDKEAIVTKIANGKVDWALGLEKFIERQAKYLASTNGPVSEYMTSFRADEDSQAATVAVEWVFKGEGRKSKGVDRFSLMRDQQGHWKIVALVWYKNK